MNLGNWISISESKSLFHHVHSMVYLLLKEILRWLKDTSSKVEFRCKPVLWINVTILFIKKTTEVSGKLDVYFSLNDNMAEKYWYQVLNSYFLSSRQNRGSNETNWHTLCIQLLSFLNMNNAITTTELQKYKFILITWVINSCVQLYWYLNITLC